MDLFEELDDEDDGECLLVGSCFFVGGVILADFLVVGGFDVASVATYS
jgi:hypothetical protein